MREEVGRDTMDCDIAAKVLLRSVLCLYFKYGTMSACQIEKATK